MYMDSNRIEYDAVLHAYAIYINNELIAYGKTYLDACMLLIEIIRSANE